LQFIAQGQKRHAVFTFNYMLGLKLMYKIAETGKFRKRRSNKQISKETPQKCVYY
jgi:hypothetical protein